MLSNVALQENLDLFGKFSTQKKNLNAGKAKKKKTVKQTQNKMQFQPQQSVGAGGAMVRDLDTVTF